MSAESQAEELEVLRSIYEGDPCFREKAPNVFQYKYGEDGEPRSFLLEISWPETYPEGPPEINLDAFYNKHLKVSVKEGIRNRLLQEASSYPGEAVTFTLVEWLKENVEGLLADQPLESCTEAMSNLEMDADKVDQTGAGGGDRKERRVAMTKSQKRRQWDRMDGKGEKSRGWNWVDVIKHLSQTGPGTLNS